jgi:pyruvate-formate lyase-activating enzyme
MTTLDDVRLLMEDLAITCRDQIHVIDGAFMSKYRDRPATKAESLAALRRAAKEVAKEAARVLERTAEEP